MLAPSIEWLMNPSLAINFFFWSSLQLFNQIKLKGRLKNLKLKFFSFQKYKLNTQTIEMKSFKVDRKVYFKSQIKFQFFRCQNRLKWKKDLLFLKFNLSYFFSHIFVLFHFKTKNSNVWWFIFTIYLSKCSEKQKQASLLQVDKCKHVSCRSQRKVHQSFGKAKLEILWLISFWFFFVFISTFKFGPFACSNIFELQKKRFKKSMKK